MTLGLRPLSTKYQKTDIGKIVKENNYLGKGVAINTNAEISTDSLKGKFGVSNPNYKNSDKSIFANVQMIEIDKLKNFGYKTNKNGFEVNSMAMKLFPK